VSRQPRPLIFGEVLFDRFPDGREVLGGAPFNVAWNLRGLGYDPIVVSAVGDDAMGRGVLDAMESWGLDRRGVQVRATYRTGTVDVTLADGEPAFDIVADRAWDRIREEELPAATDVGLVYHGSLALRQETSRRALAALLGRTRAPVMVDVNLRAPWWDPRHVRSLLPGASLVKMNEDELAALVPGDATLEERAAALREECRPELLCVTRGAAGAVAFRGPETLRVAPTEDGGRVVDTVGAGDAFASVLIAGQLRSWPLEVTLRRAQALAGAVVGLRGATTRDTAFYRRFREEWGRK